MENTLTTAQDGLYSNQVFFHSDFAQKSFKFVTEQLVFTKHALQEQTKDKNGVIKLENLPKEIDAQPFEVEVKNGHITKFCVKIDYDVNTLVALVIGVKEKQLHVYTNWLDKKTTDSTNPDPIKVKGDHYVKPEIRCDAANDILNSFMKGLI